MSKLGKSQSILAKEAQVAELGVALKKRKTTIKRLTTQLGKLKADIKDMEQRSGNLAMTVMERSVRMRQEITQLLKELLEHKKIFKNAQHKEWAESFLASFTDGFEGETEEDLDMFKTFESFMNGELPPEFEPEEARNVDPFAAFQVEPDKEEKKEIRKVYLRLSQSFHPDLAKDEAQREQSHQMMLQITNAYKRNDIQSLLDMERKFLGETMPEFASPDMSSLLDEKIDSLGQELSFLGGQSNRLSQEIKQIRSSDMGQALTAYHRDERYGQGIDQQEAEMQHAFEQLEKTKEVFKTALTKGKMTPELEKELEPQPFFDFGEMEGGEDDIFDLMRLFEALDDEPIQEIEPRFSPLQPVRYKPRKNSIPIEGVRANTNGIVTGCELNGWENIYEVYFDPKTTQHLPESRVAECVDEKFDYLFVDISEKDLKASQQKRFEIEESLTIGRQRIYQYFLDHLPATTDKALSQRMVDRLLQYQHLTDRNSWNQIFIDQQLWANVTAQVSIPNSIIKVGTPVTMLSNITYNDYVGFMIEIRKTAKPKARTNYIPLTHMRIEEPSSAQTILAEYQLWAQHRLLPIDEEEW
ncbi:MAG: J domain-containing protein [Bacteroidia bacterium]